MLIHLIIAITCATLLGREYLYDRQSNQLAIGSIFIFSIGLFSASRVVISILVLKKIFDRGWQISIPQYLLHSNEFRLGLGSHIPERETFQATPLFNNEAKDWENLKEAVLTAQGWDKERRELQQLVPLYQTRIAGMDGLVMDLLKQEGFLVEFRQSALRSAYGNQTVGMGEMIYVSKAHYAEAREFLEQYFQDNEDELAGLQ